MRGDNTMKKIKKMTLEELARKAGLSTGTVSMALRNNPLIKEKTRKYVQDLAHKLNYIPSALGRALATRSTQQIGLTITDITNPFFAEVVMGAETEAEAKNYNIILSNTTYNAEKERQAIEIFMQGVVDGIIIDPVENNKDFSLYRQLEAFDIPFVLLRKLTGLKESNFVMDDDKKAACMLTRHLIDEGAKEIAYVGSTRCGVTDHDRLLGYREELELCNIPYRENFVFEQAGFSLKDGIECGRKILGSQSNFDAVVAFNDLLAIGIIEAAREMKLEIGKDIKIVGFDNIFYASLKEIDLTTVELPKFELGRKAAEVLFELMEAKKEGKKVKLKQIVLEPKLIIRGSSTAT